MNKINAFTKNNLKIAKLLKNVSKVIIHKEFVTLNKVIIFEKVPSNIYVSNHCFINKIKDLCIDKAHEKGQLVVQADNNNKNFVLTQLSII